MKKTYESHFEKIICPECGSEQIAEVVHGAFWDAYIHHCDSCGYTITESGWTKIAEI